MKISLIILNNLWQWKRKFFLSCSEMKLLRNSRCQPRLHNNLRIANNDKPVDSSANTHIEVITQTLSLTPEHQRGPSRRDASFQSLRFQRGFDDDFHLRNHSLRRSYTVKSVDKISRVSAFEERIEPSGVYFFIILQFKTEFK